VGIEGYMDNSLLRSSSERTYASLYNKWVKMFVHKQMDQAYLQKMAHWWLYDCGLAPRTVKILLRLLCKAGEPYGLRLDPKAVTRMVMKKVDDNPVKALSLDNANKLLFELAGSKLFLPALLAFHGGLRRGEVFGLKWEDMDWIHKSILIKRSYNGPTKNGKARWVYMSPEVEKTLKYTARRSQNVVNDIFDPNPILKDVCKKLHIPIISFHALRHTFATLALEAGISPKQVQLALGHSALSTTLNIYWSATQEKMDLGFLTK